MCLYFCVMVSQSKSTTVLISAVQFNGAGSLSDVSCLHYVHTRLRIKYTYLLNQNIFTINYWAT